MDWMSLIPNLITGVVGVSAVAGTVTVARGQARADAEAEARLWIRQNAADLLAAGHGVKARLTDVDKPGRENLGEPERTSIEPLGDSVDRCYGLAAACMVGGHEGIGRLAYGLAEAIDRDVRQLARFGSVVYFLDEPLKAFSEACQELDMGLVQRSSLWTRLLIGTVKAKQSAPLTRGQ